MELIPIFCKEQKKYRSNIMTERIKGAEQNKIIKKLQYDFFNKQTGIRQMRQTKPQIRKTENEKVLCT